MFGEVTRGLRLGRIINGLQRTLGVVNQVIPIYKEAKPMIENAKNAFKVVKEFSATSAKKIIDNKDKNMQEVKEKINIIKHVNPGNNPTFFQ